MDPERARQRLSEERARVERELEAIGRTQVADEPEDTGDAAVELDQAERDEAIREELRRTLEAIERARGGERGGGGRPRGGHLRKVGRQRRADPGWAAGGDPLGRPEGRGGARR